jgi:hypothetical protein
VVNKNQLFRAGVEEDAVEEVVEAEAVVEAEEAVVAEADEEDEGRPATFRTTTKTRSILLL